MRRLVFALAILLLAGSSYGAAMERQIIGAEQDHSLAADGDCDHFFKTTFTSFEAQVDDQEQHELYLGGLSQVRVRGTAEGGISVRGWSKPHTRLIICRHAVARDKTRAQRVLSAITVTHTNGEIFAQGPPNDDSQAWWVDIILYVPRRTAIDVQASQGGSVAIRNISGSINASSENGGISVAQSSGRCRLTTGTGGITLDRVTGDIEAISREGAIALRLPGEEMPGIEAKTAEQGHIVCALKGCEDGSWASNRQALRIGTGLPQIRLSNTGAPITILGASR